jgi:tryptophan aminotransferase
VLSSLQPSSTTQLLTFTLLSHWGRSGFLEHCTGVRDFYRQKRDAFASAAERHLKGKAIWDVPSAGMFFWLTLRLPPGGDSLGLLSKKSIEYRILAIPGTACMPNLQKACQIRVSYSLVAEADMDEACKRIARMVDSTWVDKLLNWYSCRPNMTAMPVSRQIAI